MRKIKDFSHVIGIVGVGGYYSPSNEESEKKWNKIFDQLAKVRGFDKRPLRIPRDEVPLFEQIAKRLGYTIVIIERGINR